MGAGTPCYQAGKCPYDSLNVGLNKVTTVGSEIAPGAVYDDTYRIPAVQVNAARLGKV
jgi:hypothetical protein